MITTSLRIRDENGKAAKVFAAEEKALLNDRASYDVKEKDGEIVIDVEAKDATALRAVLNSICKTLIIYEKATKATDDD